MSLIGDDDPKVNRLLRPELLVVPLLLDANRAVGLDRHPGIIIADLERLPLGLLLQLEDISTLGVTVRFSELDALCRSNGACHAALLSRMLLFQLLAWSVGKVSQIDYDSLTVGICNGNAQLTYLTDANVDVSLTFRFTCYAINGMSRIRS